MNRPAILDRRAVRRPAPARLARSGFTLLELMVTIAIVAIAMGLAAPSLSRMFASNRVQTEASSFVSDLMYARSEAIKRGQGVSLCASANGKTCAGVNTWNTGWMVFSDPTQCSPVPSNTTDLTASTTNPMLRVRPGFKGGDTFKATYPTTSTTSCVSFNRDGLAVNLGGTKLVFAARNAPASTQTTRCVAVELVGRVSTLTTSDPSCT